MSLNEIKAFLNKEVVEKDQAIFQKHLAGCTLCKEVADSLLAVQDGLLATDVTFLKEAVVEKVNYRIKSKRRLFFSRVAASILLPVIGVASLLYWNLNTGNRLFNEYFQPYEIAEINTRGNTPSAIPENYDELLLPENLKKAIQNYQAGRFKESLPLFRNYRSVNAKNNLANLLYGIALLKENELEETIDLLSKLIQTDPKLKEDAIWYLALANVRKKDYQRAKELLNVLVNSNNQYYGKKAISLLQKL